MDSRESTKITVTTEFRTEMKINTLEPCPWYVETCWNHHWAQHQRLSKAGPLGCDRPTCRHSKAAPRVGVKTSSKVLNEICCFFLVWAIYWITMELLKNIENKVYCIYIYTMAHSIYICNAWIYVLYWLLLASVHFDVQFVFWPWPSSGPTFSKGLRQSRDGPRPQNSPLSWFGRRPNPYMFPINIYLNNMWIAFEWLQHATTGRYTPFSHPFKTTKRLIGSPHCGRSSCRSPCCSLGPPPFDFADGQSKGKTHLDWMTTQLIRFGYRNWATVYPHAYSKLHRQETPNTVGSKCTRDKQQ